MEKENWRHAHKQDHDTSWVFFSKFSKGIPVFYGTIDLAP